MTELVGADFAAYFKALHGYEPFPWQQRLSAYVGESGRWPNLLDVPTGLGKTSAIDVALFALAARPDVAPRRIVLVVDRRIVVDQAAVHARRIQGSLRDASNGVLGEVAGALRRLWGGGPTEAPFEVAVLRGGMPKDEVWAHRPDRPVVALSTVDQVGSRLLFRGYGVSSGMAPIHAGLLGEDTLILLDEVQLSTAFAETLYSLETRWRPWRDGQVAELKPLPDRWAFVRMSATPIGEEGEQDVRFGIKDDDRVHPEVSPRLSASKLAVLADPVTTSKNNAAKTTAALVEAFGSRALNYVKQGAKRVAVIVNRVALAGAIHAALEQSAGGDADVVLLTGRMRPLDREALFGEASDPSSIAGRVTAGRPRDPQQRAVIVVSTQTIEAGADLDFDALVTECASIDALRQRFGRLDRRGALGTSHATILVRKDQEKDSSDDPVYGAALSNTWIWLNQKAIDGCVDFGIANFPELPADAVRRSDLCSPVLPAPVLMPAHIDAWAQTNPRRAPEPDVSLWLHGPARGLAEVRIVWRADLDAVTLNDPELDDPDQRRMVEERVATSLAIAPPSSLESISVPLSAAAAWLRRTSIPDFADVEGAGDSGNDRREEQGRPRGFVIATKAGARVMSSTSGLSPEVTIIVPATYGGIRGANWSPDATDPVSDLGDLAQLVHRRRPVLRLVPAVLSLDWSDTSQPSAAEERPASGAFGIPREVARSVPRQTEDPEFEPREAVRVWLQVARNEGSTRWQVVVDALLRSKKALRIVELGDGNFAVSGHRLTREQMDAQVRCPESMSDITGDDDDAASYIGEEVTLDQHLTDVERWVRAFGENLGLPLSLVDDLALSARLHDIGKADPRFQQMLHGGSAVRMAASDELLAKSRGDASDRIAREQARERSEYPKGYRHELLSVAMLNDQPAALRDANDAELVLHLVGSHHGWCRPFAPSVNPGPNIAVAFEQGEQRFHSGTAHALAAADSGVADRFWSLTERYGWWRLAWFECLVRLADHRASEESAERGVANA